MAQPPELAGGAARRGMGSGPQLDDARVRLGGGLRPARGQHLLDPVRHRPVARVEQQHLLLDADAPRPLGADPTVITHRARPRRSGPAGGTSWCSSTPPRCTCTALDSGISCHTPGSSENGSDTINAVIAGHALEALVARMQLADRVDVGRGEQRARGPGRRVAHGPQRLAVGDAEGGLHRVLDPVRPGDLLDQADRALQRARPGPPRARRSARGGTPPRCPSSRERRERAPGRWPA